MMPNTQNFDAVTFANALAVALSAASDPNVIRKAQTVGAPVGPYVHGPGGLFGVRGLERDVISTHTQITGSLGESIPIVASADQSPLFPYITGFVRSDTQEKNGVCDDPEEAGQFMTCILTTQFGRKEFKTPQMEVNRIGQTINRGEFTDLNLVNSPLVNSMRGLMAGFFGLQKQGAILAGNEVASRMVAMAVAFQRWYCPTVYTGNPSNNKAGGGYKEFPGLDLLISTTKIDALTGTACPSLRSDVKSFGYRQISNTNDPDLYRTLSTMMYILESKARQQNLAPVEFAIVMRPQLFWEISRYWPSQYNTDGTGTAFAAFDSLYRTNIEMRDAMRNGNYLLINSKQYRVILDDCIMEENQSVNGAIPIGGFASDIYIVPLTARGGTLRTLYWEYYDYRNDVLPQMSGLPMWYWSDNGAFLWSMKAPDNWCFEVIAKTEPRLILRTPQLAGRLTDVVYVPLQHTDDPLPSQYYHVSSGVSGRPFPSPFSEWNASGPGPGA